MNEQRSMRAWWWIGAFILGVWVLVGIAVPWAVVGAGLSSVAVGQAGDMFGSVNALFSALALLGVLYTLIQQRRQLGLQMEELRLQREEMRESREVLELQARAQQDWVETQRNAVSATLLGAQITAQSQLLASMMPIVSGGDIQAAQKGVEGYKEAVTVLEGLRDQARRTQMSNESNGHASTSGAGGAPSDVADG